MKSRAFALLSSLSVLASFNGLMAQSYTFQVLECGAYTAFPTAINNQGTVVGSASTFNSVYSLGFVYANGTCQTTSLGLQGTSFLGVTDTNEIVGLYSQQVDYLNKAGKFQGLPPYPGAYGTYYGWLNTSTALLAGNYLKSGSLERYGFLYQNGKFAPLPDTDSAHIPSIGGMNKQGIVVGTMNSLNLTGFVYLNGKMSYYHFPNAKYTYFNGINDNNLIVGTYSGTPTGGGGPMTYNLDTGVWTDLKFQYPYNGITPVGITNSGVIAAQYTPSGGLVIATPSAQ